MHCWTRAYRYGDELLICTDCFLLGGAFEVVGHRGIHSQLFTLSGFLLLIHATMITVFFVKNGGQVGEIGSEVHAILGTHEGSLDDLLYLLGSVRRGRPLVLSRPLHH